MSAKDDKVDAYISYLIHRPGYEHTDTDNTHTWGKQSEHYIDRQTQRHRYRHTDTHIHTDQLTHTNSGQNQF